jgi:hypothetical protein
MIVVDDDQALASGDADQAGTDTTAPESQQNVDVGVGGGEATASGQSASSDYNLADILSSSGIDGFDGDNDAIANSLRDRLNSGQQADQYAAERDRYRQDAERQQQITNMLYQERMAERQQEAQRQHAAAIEQQKTDASESPWWQDHYQQAQADPLWGRLDPETRPVEMQRDMQQYESALHSNLNGLANPGKFFEPVIAEANRRSNDGFDDRVAGIVMNMMKERDEHQQLNHIEQENQAWLYEQDGNGQVVVGPEGPKFSPLGNVLQQTVSELTTPADQGGQFDTNTRVGRYNLGQLVMRQNFEIDRLQRQMTHGGPQTEGTPEQQQQQQQAIGDQAAAQKKADLLERQAGLTANKGRARTGSPGTPTQPTPSNQVDWLSDFRQTLATEIQNQN